MEKNGAGTGQTYSSTDRELINQLIKSRLEQKAQVEYEELEGYELPPRTQFSMLSKPTLSIKYREFTCNMACIRLFEGVKYVLPIVNRSKKRFAIVPCAEEESSSVQWAREKDGKWENKTIISLEFIEKIFAMMNWDRNCRYKILGRVANSSSGLILIFDLEEAIFFAAEPTEYVDKKTGKVTKRKTIYYPDEYKDRIGKSYNDYAAVRQMSIFEYLEEYIGKTYSDAQREDYDYSGETGVEEKAEEILGPEGNPGTTTETDSENATVDWKKTWTDETRKGNSMSGENEPVFGKEEKAFDAMGEGITQAPGYEAHSPDIDRPDLEKGGALVQESDDIGSEDE